MAQPLTAAQKRILGIKDTPASTTPAAKKATTKAPATTTKAPSGKSMTVDSALLQQAIIDLGGNVGSTGADGKWGPNSKTGLQSVCKAHGVYYTSSERSGTSVKVNPEGAAVLVIGLNEIKKKKDVSAASLSTPGMVYTAVLQTLLNKLGFLSSQINGKNQLDGKFGANTQAALVAASTKLGGYYKNSSAFASLAGTTITPAAVYLKIWQAMWFGLDFASKAESAAASQAASKTSAITPTPAPQGEAAPTAVPSAVKKPSGSAGTAYRSGDVQNLLNWISTAAKEPSLVVVDGNWGPKSKAALKQVSAKYNLKYSGSSGFGSKNSSVLVNPGDLVPKLFTVYVALREGKTPPTEPTKVPPTAPEKPKDQGKIAGKPGRSYDSKEIQNLLLSLGGSLPKYGADGKWGSESKSALQAAAQKYNLAYRSSTTYNKQKSVIIDPAELVGGLQKALVNKRAVDAASADVEAKAQADAKKKKAEEDEANSKAEKEKAAKAQAEADAAVQDAKDKVERAKKAESKAAKKESKAAEKAVAKKAKKEAAEAVVAAKKKSAAAKAQKAVADTTKQQAAQTTRDAIIAAQTAAATTQQAQEVITDSRSQAAQIVTQQPVYQAEAEMPVSPGPSAESSTPSAQEQPSVPAAPTGGISTGAMVAIGLGAVAIAAAIMMKKPAQKKLPAGARGLGSMYRSRRRKLRHQRKFRRLGK